MGPVNDTYVKIDGVPCNALLDTGSQISCLSEYFVRDRLPEVEIMPLEKLCSVKGVSGHELPYVGYIEVELVVPSGVSRDNKLDVLLLVTQGPSVSNDLPVLIGTNVIEACAAQRQSNSKCPRAWKLAFDWCEAREASECKVDAQVYSQQVTIPKQGQEIVDVQFAAQKGVKGVFLLSDEDVSLAEGLFVEPVLVDESLLATGQLSVAIQNLSCHDVEVPKNACIGKFVPVNVISCAANVTNNSVEDGDALSHFPLSSLENLLSNTEFEKLKEVILDHKAAFSFSDLDLGRVKDVVHRIELDDDVPVRERYRKIPPNLVGEVKKHLDDMLRAGVIEPSKSSYSSPTVLVRKKDSSLRFCVDYRSLNRKSKIDSFSLPRIDDSFDRLKGSKWFSTLDLKSGYWQVPLDSRDKEKTAFSVGQCGFFQYTVLPMGLKNATATFQRMVEGVMSNLEWCQLFLDDVIVFSETVEQHLERLKIVFEKLSAAGLKLKPEKCHFLQKRVEYLGHIISEDGISASDKKVAAVRNWPTPRNRDDLRRFLGFCGYMRKFVRNFSQICEPLNELLKGEPLRKKDRRKFKSNASKVKPFVWEKCHEDAFRVLIRELTQAPVLAFADYDQEFVLQTDASTSGLGAVLYQHQDGHKRVIAYASRTVSQSESRYPAHKLEMLALKWAVCDKFKDYLLGSRFLIETDNNPLTFLLTTARLDATGHRWVAELSMFNFDIKYKPGKLNVVADSLSRMYSGEQGYVDRETVQALFKAVSLDCLVSCVAVSGAAFPVVQSDVIRMVSDEDLREAQKSDECIRVVIDLLQSRLRQLPDDASHEVKWLWRERSHLEFRDGVLYRRRKIDGANEYQLVLPAMYRKMAFQLLHTNNGHFGCERTVELFRKRFYWPKMQSQVEKWVKMCEQCVKRKGVCDKAPLHHLQSTYPMELICIDFLKVERSIGGFEHVLVMTDHFSRYAIAIPTKNESAKVVAKILIDNVVNHYGIPSKIHSDQGKSFECNLIKEMCDLLNISKSRTSPYHAMGNGQTERFNRTLLDMLGTLKTDQKLRWKDHVASLVHAYNCTKNDSTGYSPFFLMYGRNPRLPVDLAFGLCEENEEMSYSDYVYELRERLESAYDSARKQVENVQGMSKNRYDTKVRGAALKVGDRVLVRKTYFAQGRHKIDNKWENDVCIVINQPNDEIPVYEIRREDGKGRMRRLHRNLLLPVNHIGEEWQASEKSKGENVNSKPKLRSSCKDQSRNDSASAENESGESESEQSSESESDSEMSMVVKRNVNNVENVANNVENVANNVENVANNVENVNDGVNVPADVAVNVPVNDVPAVQDVEQVAEGRPVRERRPPKWYTSGDYITNCTKTVYYV